MYGEVLRRRCMAAKPGSDNWNSDRPSSESLTADKRSREDDYLAVGKLGTCYKGRVALAME